MNPMKLESFISDLNQQLLQLQAVKQYVLAHSVAFELLENCNVHHLATGWELWCTPPNESEAAFGRLLGECIWKRYDAGIYYHWSTMPPGAPCRVVILNAEKKPQSGMEVTL